MDEKLKNLWLAALESGHYRQVSNQLKSGDEYCCLGVLADVCLQNDMVPEGVVIRLRPYGTMEIGHNGLFSAGYLGHSNELSDSFGLTAKQARKLASLNDTGQDFPAIAAYIREEI